MTYRYEFDAPAARDVERLCRHNVPLLVAILVEHLPAILLDPLAAGEKKKGDLAHVRAYPFNHRGTAYRLVYTLEGDVVTVVAIGTHDEAYARAARRR